MKNLETMTRPALEIIPQRRVARSDKATELAILVRIAAPRLARTAARPNLNLSLVLDRSGSMGGEKLAAAKKAAIFAIQQLEDTDRISVVIYDDEVETLIAPTLARDKASLIARIGAVRAGGSTALYDGWVTGATHVAAHLDARGLNRVLLLTDGLANAGETDPKRICEDVKSLAARGVSTSTLGVGDDFNEDLLQNMASAGDGNYYFIEGAADLERIFASELSGLMATLGRKVSLGLEPQNGAEAGRVLSNLPKNELGRLQLPNLVAGNALEAVFKLQIPALRAPTDVLFCRLAFDAPDSKERVVMRAALSLAGVSKREWEAAPLDADVQSAVAKLEIARERELIAQQLDAGDIAGARTSVQMARQMAVAAPMSSAEHAAEALDFDALEASLDEGNAPRAAKQAKYDAYRRHQSRE